MKFNGIASFWIWVIALAVLAAFFFFCMRGYTYISYTLLFIAAMIVIFHLGGDTLKRTAGILAALGLIYFCLCEIPIVSNAKTDPEPEEDYLVVLGAAVHGDVPSLSLLHRLQGALKYLEEYPDSKAVVCGGQGKGENLSEGACMKNWLVENGIDEGRILAETKSVSTMENLLFAKEIIEKDGGSVKDTAILSSPYHLYRAKSMAGSIGYEPKGVACVHGYPIYSLGMYIREAFGVTHLWVFGN